MIKAMALALLLAGCIVPEPGVRPGTYDFGQMEAPAATPGLPVLAISDVQAPRHLHSTLVYYRLAYSDAQMPKPYADSRWAMPPPQLVAQRLKNRLARHAAVLSSADAHADLRLLVELEQFDQVFDSPEQSRGVVVLRASLIRNQKLLAQQSFSADKPALSADGPGGVHALTQATDAALNQLADWVQAHAR